MATPSMTSIPCPQCGGGGETRASHTDPTVVENCPRCSATGEIAVDAISDDELAAHYCQPAEHCDLCCVAKLRRAQLLLAKAEERNHQPAALLLAARIEALETGHLDHCPCGCGQPDAWKGLVAA